MRAIVVGRLKKWMIFALIGCGAYFMGYVWGHRNQAPNTPPTPPVIAPK